MKVSVYIATTLDGFIAREDGRLDWLPGAEPEAISGAEEEDCSPDSLPRNDSESSGSEDDYGYREFMDSVDVLVMGRKTFENVLSFGMWPYEKKRVIVLSSGRLHIPTNLAQSVEARSCSPRELVDQLEQTGAEHLYVDGGNTIQRFLNAGLIQQVIITRIPVLIGSGIPLFGPIEDDIFLHHVETRQFPSGFVQSRYEVTSERG